MVLLLTRELVLKKLATVFPDPAIAQHALTSLDSYGGADGQPAKEAVQLAILKSCDGMLWRLRELVKLAKGDFRDVLYPAQAPERFKDSRENQQTIRSGADIRFPTKKNSPSKAAAMEKRDQAQCVAWLSTD
jgi:hypothetical protein